MTPDDVNVSGFQRHSASGGLANHSQVLGVVDARQRHVIRRLRLHDRPTPRRNADATTCNDLRSLDALRMALAGSGDRRTDRR
jgi:hypothetical protein